MLLDYFLLQYARMASLEIHVNSVVNAKLQAYAIKLQECVHMVVSRATKDFFAIPVSSD